MTKPNSITAQNIKTAKRKTTIYSIYSSMPYTPLLLAPPPSRGRLGGGVSRQDFCTNESISGYKKYGKALNLWPVLLAHYNIDILVSWLPENIVKMLVVDYESDAVPGSSNSDIQFILTSLLIGKSVILSFQKLGKAVCRMN